MFNQMNSGNNCRIGIGSFAYRYAIGFKDFKPAEPMDVFDFIRQADQLGFAGVQLCENLGYAGLTEKELEKVREEAARLGLFIELGMKNLSRETLRKHIRIGKILSVDFLRVVIGNNIPADKKNYSKECSEILEILRASLPELKKEGIKLGLENHFDLPSAGLYRVVKGLDDDHIGLIFDTTNCLGFTEKPIDVFNLFKPYLFSVHLKDYYIKKIEAGYMMTGAVLGAGWLNTKKMIKESLYNELCSSIIIEMTTRRDMSKTQEEILVWENNAIKASKSYLDECIKECL